MEKRKDELLTEHGITTKQEVVAAALARGESVARIAANYDVARSTIYTWLSKDAAFVRYYKTLLAEVRQELRGAISAMAEEATATLKDLMNKGKEESQLKAAMYIIDRLSDDEKRISKALHNDGKKK